ncbi:MAG: hypothetical protein ACPGJV_06740 [Bacteriovoracaceae bacterium]
MRILLLCIVILNFNTSSAKDSIYDEERYTCSITCASIDNYTATWCPSQSVRSGNSYREALEKATKTCIDRTNPCFQVFRGAVQELDISANQRVKATFASVKNSCVKN